jgi:PPM family protein phosphatase
MAGVQPAAVLPSPTVVLHAGASTSSGKRRAGNEDAHAVGDRICLVADGMGGHAAGDVAAALAVASIMASLTAGALPSRDDVASAVRAANRTIRDAASRLPSASGMGTTVVGAAVVSGGAGQSVAVFHVGDSRCYRWHAGELRLVTRDHSLVQQLVDDGRLSPADAGAHPMGNVVTRALGADADVDPDVVVFPAAPCRLLLCSDGLHDELPARAIGRVLAGIDDPQVAAGRLVDLVLLGPARDNVTAVVVDVVVDVLGDPMLDTPGAVDHDGARSDPTARR